MKHILRPPYIPDDGTVGKKLNELGVTTSDLPPFLFKEVAFKCGSVIWLWLKFCQWFLRIPFYLILRPRKEPLGELDAQEILRVYDKEAAWYDIKHHLTTYWWDTVWRKHAAEFVIDVINGSNRMFKVLDVCSGTGLTAWYISNKVSRAGLSNRVMIMGIDLCKRMLTGAKSRIFPAGAQIEFSCSDATNLVDGNGQVDPDEAVRFDHGTFDAATIMCGIGGIKDSIKAFEQILRVLKEGGQLFVSDMHCPIPGYVDDRSWSKRAFPMMRFAQATWYWSTVPIALGILWGWKDPTMDFWQLPFITYTDEHEQNWGFSVVRRNFQIEPWWLRLPLSPVCEIVVRKEHISSEEAERRRDILSLI